MQSKEDVTRVFMRVNVIFDEKELDALKNFVQNKALSELKNGDSLDYSAQSNSIIVHSLGEYGYNTDTIEKQLSEKKRLGYMSLTIDNLKALVTM